MSGEELSLLFDQGPPHNWQPIVNDRVAAFIGGTPNAFIFDEGKVIQHFEEQHVSGQKIHSYQVRFADGCTIHFSRNNLRPLPEVENKP